jgi:hypothetical protein
MTVLDLGRCRDYLAALDDVRRLIREGDVDALALTVRHRDGTEATLFLGAYADEPDAALRVSLAAALATVKLKPKSRPARVALG